MFASAVVYSGLVLVTGGLIAVVKPLRWLGLRTRLRGLAAVAAGVTAAGIGFVLPAPESRVSHAETRLDEFAPAWQFREIHTIRIAAPPARVFADIRRVRPDEIFLFRTLIRIRAGGRPLPENIRKAGEHGEVITHANVTSRKCINRLPQEPTIGL